MAGFTTVVLLIAVFIATLGEAVPNRGRPGSDKQLMTSMIQDVESAWARQDATTIASKFAKDGVFVHKGLGMRKGRDAIMSGVKQLFRKSPTLKIRPVAYGFGKGFAFFVLNKVYKDINGGMNDESTDIEIMKQSTSGDWEIVETMEFQTNLVPFPRMG